MGQWILIGWLGVLSWQDIRWKKVSVWTVCLAAACGACCLLVFHEPGWKSVLAGAGIGGGLAIFSLAGRGRVGMGDALVFLVTAFYLGFEKNLSLFFLSSLIAAAFAVFLLVSKKGTGKDSFPFVPCVFFAELFLVAGGLLFRC